VQEASTYKQGRFPAHAVLDRHRRRLAAHDGLQTRSESLFYYFLLEDQVPENHLLRLIDRDVSFDFVREKLKQSYSDTGRPATTQAHLRLRGPQY